MEINKAQELAKSLFEKHGLSKWVFKFDKASRRFGVCKRTKHIICLSKKLVLLNNEQEVKDVLLHEIAHALVRVKHHHDKVWKRKAIEIGCRPIPYYGKEVILPPRLPKFEKGWVAACPKCGKEFTNYRKHMTKFACWACFEKYNNGKYSEEFLLNWRLK